MINQIYEKIKIEMLDLPGESAHVDMIPFRKVSSLAVKDKSNFRLSAVMIILYAHNNQIHTVLTERQSYNGKHSGQMSFPGGKKEGIDLNTRFTAIRETTEEIGVQISPDNILGQLTDVYIPVSNFLVHPYVAFSQQRPDFLADEREVKSIIEFPVNSILQPESRVLTKVQNHKGIWMKDIPCFEIEKKAVWGATALMLNEFRMILERVKTSF